MPFVERTVSLLHDPMIHFFFGIPCSLICIGLVVFTKIFFLFHFCYFVLQEKKKNAYTRQSRL